MITFEKKIWGETAEIFWSPHCSVHFLRTNAGFCCSTHCHQDRSNRFFVEQGRIAVMVYPGGGDEKRIELGPGEVYDVPSLQFHRFEVIESGLVWEIYQPDRGGEVSRDDIIRLDVGHALPE